MPDPLADPDVLALVDLGGLDKLLLQGCRVPPIDHVAGALVLVCAQDKASIMWSEARREHASAPRPPRGLELGFPLMLNGLVGDLDVLASVAGLLLTWVRDLGDHRQFHLLPRHADAPEVAVTHSEDTAIAPDGVVRLDLGLLDNLQALVEVNPTAATRALVAEHLLGHEIVGGLDTDADVLGVALVWQTNLVPEGLAFSIVLGVVVLLDLDIVHVHRAVGRSLVRQWAQAAVQEVNDR
mmetsp:Transcript_22230/g.60751  ORF Transcript_22230/g.60751 Transcript_22230/m.60751 type:complete len:239 (-) Transcript_22230:637-1353(-)